MEAPIYEVFLVLHPVSSRLAQLAHALEPLVTGDTPFRDLDVYLRAGADTALLALRYDERGMDGDQLRRLDDTARGGGLTLLDPARLGVGERRALFEVRLPQFTVCARGLVRARDAMVAIADQLNAKAVPRATPPDGMPRLDVPPPVPAPSPAARPRVVVNVPPLSSLPEARATTTRPAPRGPRDSQPRIPPPRPPTLPPPPEEITGAAIARVVPRTATSDDRLALSLAEQARAARRIAEQTMRIAPPEAIARTVTELDGPDTEPVDISDVGDVVPVAPIHSAETSRLRNPRQGSEPGAPGAFVIVEDVPAPQLDVRFLRGNEWVPVRARALSARGAYLVTGAPARLGDTVHVSVSCDGRTALVRGTVYHVTTADDALTTGASGFAVRFPEYACPARTHLVQVLLAARNAGVTLRPPPSRGAVRFPVRWPVTVKVGDDVFRAEAQDVSTGGLFLATSRPIDLGSVVEFTLSLDLADLPVEGTGRITRVLPADEAAQRGMRPGAGMRITEMGSEDRAAWDAFLARVRRRTEKRVLIGAAPGRVEELAAGLCAAGYTVTSGSDLGLLMRVAELDPCPPDLAVIDADFDASAAPAGWIEQIFAARQVQCVTVRGDVRRARSVVDRLLHVES